MKITGTQARNEIKSLMTELTALNNGFTDLLTYREGTPKPDVVGETEKMLSLERKIGMWQAAQKEFNTEAHITFNGRVMNLQEAVSTIGGYSRISKLFKDASGAGKKERYGRTSSRRTGSYEAATNTTILESISVAEALAGFRKVEKDANDLRALIGKANNTEVDIPWLESALATA